MIGEREQLNHLFNTVENAKREWEVTMDCIGDMVLLTDREMAIKRCNAAVLAFTGRGYKEMIGKRWPDILGDSTLAENEFNEFNDMATEYYHKPSKRWFYLNAHTLTLGDGSIGQVITLHDFTAQQRATKALEEKKHEVEDAYAELKQTQGQLLQQEKMASIGQLAAGVAHEINNPVGFISSNLGSLAKYVERLSGFIKFQAEIIRDDANTGAIERQKERRRQLKLDFIQEDITGLIDESLDGCERVKKIVRDLKGFSRVDEAEKQDADINECLETTLNIAWNELKYKAKIEKDYGELPTIECYPQQLNQVFMNLLINAAHAIEKEGIIKIKTWHDKEFLYISISDNGQGISPENQKRIFEPFFTTKEVGKGTGLGLSIVYDIVTKNHKGDIGVESEKGGGTTFTVKLPII
ncbi:MAG: GHKL domain-containing protein [Deltaproteobacteria bacterium]|nr:GHKL domain-containing protein [Deltaproteobacteria bacterium]